MRHLLFIFIFIFPTILLAIPEKHPLTIHLINQRNGKGLETDEKIFKEALEKLGCLVKCLDYEETKWSHADINIFFQNLIPAKFKWARINWFLPNPEWYFQEEELLQKVDLILCRTHEVERIFRKLNKQVYYLGFTSPDCYQPEIAKDYSHLFHLAGGSSSKGTSAIQEIWLAHPHLPLLTVVKYPSELIFNQPNLKWIGNPISLHQLRLFQNQCGIHLCPSETEGFGHYIMEGMSAAAVIVTTDAPPMNEFIKDRRCLVPYVTTAPNQLATNYYVNTKELQNKIERLSRLPLKELQTIGRKNRETYLKKRQEFYSQLEQLIEIASTLIALTKEAAR